MFSFFGKKKNATLFLPLVHLYNKSSDDRIMIDYISISNNNDEYHVVREREREICYAQKKHGNNIKIKTKNEND